jgi:hypothetical protein
LFATRKRLKAVEGELIQAREERRGLLRRIQRFEDAARTAGSDDPVPAELVLATESPPRGGSTLLLTTGDGDDVIAVISAGGADARSIWAEILDHARGRRIAS